MKGVGIKLIVRACELRLGDRFATVLPLATFVVLQWREDLLLLLVGVKDGKSKAGILLSC